MQFDNVEINRDDVYGKRKAGEKPSAYAKIWALILKETRKGKAVEYEEYSDSEGKMRCKGSITD